MCECSDVCARADVCACGMREREGEQWGGGCRDQSEEETEGIRQAIVPHFLAFTVSIEVAKIGAYRVTTNKDKERMQGKL